MASVLEGSKRHMKGRLGSARGAWPWLCLILAASVLTQFPFRERPLFGNFASYQVLMGMMAKMMARENFADLLHPKLFYILSGVPSLHLVHYPIASLAAALGHRLLGGSIDWWGRFQAVAFTQGATVLLYAAARRLMGARRALLAAAVYAASPMVLIYGQSFQNEAAAAFFMILAFYLCVGAPGPGRALAAGFLFSVSVCARHHVLFCLPGFLVFLWMRERVSPERLRRIGLFTASALTLPALWLAFVYWSSAVRTDIYTHPFIQAAVGKTFPHPLLLSPEFYKRVLGDAISLYFNPIGFTFFVLALAFTREQKMAFAVVWVASVAALGVLVPVKIFDHPFYVFPLLPAGALLIARALGALRWQTGRFSTAFFAAVYCAFSLLAAVGPIYKHDPADKLVLQASGFLRARTDPQDLVIDGYRGVMLTLYYADRFGWPFLLKARREISPYWSSARLQNLPEDAWRERNAAFETPAGWLEYLRKQGADIFIAPDRAELEAVPDFLRYLRDRYREISARGDPFLAFDVRQLA